MTDEGKLHDIDSGAPDPLELLLADAGIGVFPDHIQRQVDTVLSAGQSLELDARGKFVEAAKRGTRQWNLRENASLETLLFEARREQSRDIATIAEAIGADAETVRSIERGERAVDSEQPMVVAAWALNVDLDRTVLNEGLARSLGTRGMSPAYAGDDRVRLDRQKQDFVDAVLRAYDDRAADAAG